MGHEKPQQGQELRLDGTRVLLVEDEFYIADDIRKTLLNAGAFVVGPVSTVERATQAVEEGAFDCAIVDLNLHGKSAAPVAERLFALGRSFAIATGYGSGEVPPHLNAVPADRKAFRSAGTASITDAARLRECRLIRCLDYAEQPQDKDQDQDTAKSDIHGIPPVSCCC